MNETNDTAVIHPVPIVRPGLLDRLKTNSGIRTDEAFAASIGISRATLDRLRKGDTPDLRTVVMIARSYGIGLSEVVTEVDPSELDAELAAAG
ncbi:helix-turn-helix domain-containing protein [Leucobacter luti]|uniref:helix-turn-helix domain-containing protein n=1 Tax=Leucobacter luti TaxID=340320 RepID=UPI003D085FA2